MLNLRVLIVALLVAVAGCATSDRAADPTPAVLISQSTWRQVDRDIVAASLAATGQADNYAHHAMENWMDLVYQRTDADFIPWYNGYWTQQWLTMKVGWYKLSTGGETDPAINRLASYLQEQYQERVLDPVARQINPELIMQQTTNFYVQHLGEQLQGIPQRYAVPLDQFDRHLQGIPAIALAPPAARSASLYQLVHADPLAKLPAYVALLERVGDATDNAGAGSADTGIATVAKRTSEKLAAELATRSAASAASAVVGRAAGMVISLGAASYSAIARENERPAMEALLRENLNADFDQEWLDLLHNPASGVLAGVYYLSGQIEGSLATDRTLPVKFAPPVPGIPAPSAQPLQYRNSDGEAPTNYWNPDE